MILRNFFDFSYIPGANREKKAENGWDFQRNSRKRKLMRKSGYCTEALAEYPCIWTEICYTCNILREFREEYL